MSHFSCVGKVPSGGDSSLASDVETDTVYCDGACKGNGQAVSAAGIGVWWANNHVRCV
jgi:hypothetical protein